MKFSQRQGITKVRSILQEDEIDTDLRNSLWNLFELTIFKPLNGHDFVEQEPGFRIIRSIWLNFFKLPLDELKGYWPQDKDFIREWFFKAQWHEKYDLVEYVAVDLKETAKWHYIHLANRILEKELSAFRFVQDQLTRITSNGDTEALNKALTNADRFLGVRSHLENALDKLGNRQHPDYRNSIKESISAVEALCQQLTNDPKATLGSTIKRLQKGGIIIHQSLEKAWSALYGYTSDEGGIRLPCWMSQVSTRVMLATCWCLAVLS